jgi:hypothetical protein
MTDLIAQISVISSLLIVGIVVTSKALPQATQNLKTTTKSLLTEILVESQQAVDKRAGQAQQAIDDILVPPPPPPHQ